MDVQTRPRQHPAPAGRVLTGALRSGRHEALDEWISTSPARSAELSVHVSRCGPRPVVTVIGALDTGGAALLSAMLDHVRETEGRGAEVDLSRVDYADSHGLAPLLDGQAPIRQASPVVRRLLAALGRPLPRSPQHEPPST